MRWFILMAMVMSATLVHGKTTNEKALSAYNAAKEALQQGDLATAEKAARDAIRLVGSDGRVMVDTELTLDIVRVGRVSKANNRLVGRYESYAPNALLTQIATIKREQQQLAYLADKRRRPPHLVLSDIQLEDEDGDLRLAAFEQGAIQLVLVNRGESNADDVRLVLTTQPFSVEGLNITLNVGSLAPGQTFEKRLPVSMPKNTEDRMVMLASVEEKHDLGTFVNRKFALPSRAYLAPVITLDRIHEHSEPVQPGRIATQRFRLTNQGLGTGWDIQLALDLDYADRVQIAEHIDLMKIKQLKPGESRDITFAVRAQRELALNTPLGLSLSVKHRGNDSADKRSLALVTEGRKVEFDAPQLSLSSEIGLHAAPPRHHGLTKRQHQTAEIAVLVSTLRAPKPAQLNNINFMRKAFASRGLKDSDVHEVQVGTLHDWTALLTRRVPQWLAQAKAQRLHLYLDTTGKWHARQREAALGIQSSVNTTHWVSLASVLESLENIHAEQLSLYIEASMLASDEVLPTVLWKQPLVNRMPTSIALYSAAQPQAAAMAHAAQGVGIFTYALGELIRSPELLPEKQAIELQSVMQTVGVSLHQYQPMPYISVLDQQ